MKRRHFFKSLGGITAGFLAVPGVPAALTLQNFKKTATGMSRGKKYWTKLRDLFLLPRDYVYLNTGGLGSCPQMVINTVREKMAEEDAHPNAGHNEQDWWNIKEKCAALFGPGVKKEELALVGTASEGINIIINGLPLKKGDEVITSTHEHVALNVPLLYKEKTGDIIIKTFDPDPVNSSENVKRIEKLINKRTRLIITSHITCTTGQVMPVKEIGEMAKARGVWYALDGAQAVGQLPLDIKEIGVDFYTVSGHKWILAPRRTGILYVREKWLDTLKPTVVGAYSNSGYDMKKRQIELHPTAQRYEYGTQNEALFYGLGEALDFISTIGIKNIRDHNRRLAEMFYENLKKIPGVEICSPQEKMYRSAMITFRVRNLNNRDICRRFEKQGLRVRSVTEADMNAIRVSFHVYNTEEECARLLLAIKSLSRV